MLLIAKQGEKVNYRSLSPVALYATRKYVSIKSCRSFEICHTLSLGVNIIGVGVRSE